MLPLISVSPTLKNRISKILGGRSEKPDVPTIMQTRIPHHRTMQRFQDSRVFSIALRTLAKRKEIPPHLACPSCMKTRGVRCPSPPISLLSTVSTSLRNPPPSSGTSEGHNSSVQLVSLWTIRADILEHKTPLLFPLFSKVISMLCSCMGCYQFFPAS
jgi:hypothetical protein